jgi:hypothetical protein
MYESLREHCDSFHLYVFAFDDLCYETLKKLSLENTTVVSLNEFETPELLALKTTRSRAEYCWTCSSNSIRYAIDRFGLDACTYLDADLYFWGSPKSLFDEMGDRSILITEHRYTPKYDQSKTSGKYCVQFMTFRNDKRGNLALNWWRDACNEWCYARIEDGKFGDQKYLDDWPERFEGVHVLRHQGGGLAPWNIQQYELAQKDNRLICESIASSNQCPVIFYHFHSIVFYTNGSVYTGDYRINKNIKKNIYGPYVTHLEEIAERLPTAEVAVLTHGARRFSWTNPRNILRHLQHICMKHVLSKTNLIEK